MRSLVRLSLEPEFRRGHGALYDALSAGRVDDERLFSLLTEVLPPLVDGPEGRAWIAGHDVIDRRLLDRALSGVPAADAARVRDACARWRRVRVAVDATSYPRPDAWCSPEREHVHHGACHCKGSSKTTPGWEYQLAAVTGHLRTAWAAAVDVQRTTPATRTAQTIAQVKSVLRRLPGAGHASGAVPLFVFDAGYSAAALTDGLAGCLAHILVRLPAGSVFYQDATAWPGRNGGPATGGRRSTAWNRRHSRRPPRAGAAGAGRSRCPRPPSQTRSSPFRTPRLRHRPGRGMARRHPRSTATAAGSPAGTSSRCCAVLSSPHRRAAPRRPRPHRQLWLWHAGPGPLSLDELWRAYLARFDIEHAIRTLKGTLGLTAAKVRTPEQADRWARVVIAAHAQLLLARPLSADLRRPWEKHPGPDRPLSPGRVRRGFRNIHRDLGTPARVPKPARPGPGRPKGTSTRPAPRHLLPGEADMPRTANAALTRKKVKSKARAC